MGYVGELPGMYYDKEKGKYFKIQADSASSGQSAYSSETVKRRKLEEQRTQAVEKENLRQKGRIRRSIQDTLNGGILAREYGNRTGCLDGPRIFAKGMVSRAYRWGFGQSSNVIFAVHKREDLGPSIVDFRLLHNDRLETTRLNADVDGLDDDDAALLPFLGDSVEEHLGHPGTSTSLSIHEAQQILAATWMAGSPHSGIAIVPIGSINEPGPNIVLGPGRSRGAEVDVCSSTAAPESSSLAFAIGTSAGIITIDKQNVNAYFLNRDQFPAGHGKDVFALEFLSEVPSVLMSGGRNGILNMTDLRVPNFGAQADVIKHQSSITHIRQLDTHRIIVAGLKSTLCQYDLRFRKGPTRTQSVLQYPEYQNTAYIRIGFDVDVESGVVAAAQQHDISHPPIQLFSLHGGYPLQSNVCGFNPTLDHNVVPCLRFVRDVENRMKSLYVASNMVRKYSF